MEKNNRRTAVCFHNPVIHVEKGKPLGLLDSEENELGFNIWKEKSFYYVLIWSKSLTVESKIKYGTVFFTMQKRAYLIF